jgi:hypothetical protein
VSVAARRCARLAVVLGALALAPAAHAAAPAFAPPERYDLGAEAQSLAVADFTGDGRPDVVVGTGVTTLGVQRPPPANDMSLLLFVSRPDGTLAPPLVQHFRPGVLVVREPGDVDGDGIADLAILAEDRVLLLRGGPTGLSPPRPVGGTGSSVEALQLVAANDDAEGRRTSYVQFPIVEPGASIGSRSTARTSARVRRRARSSSRGGCARPERRS